MTNENQNKRRIRQARVYTPQDYDERLVNKILEATLEGPFKIILWFRENGQLKMQQWTSPDWTNELALEALATLIKDVKQIGATVNMGGITGRRL